MTARVIRTAVPPAAALRRERIVAFWRFQAVFWGANLALRTFAALQRHPEFAWTYMPERLALVGAGLLATSAIAWFVWRADAWPLAARIALAFGLSLVAMLPMQALEDTLARRQSPTWLGLEFVEYAAQFGWVFLMWAGYFFAQDFAFRVRRQAAEITAAQEEAHQAQLKMLRYQLNPHFLFNALNAVSALVLENRRDEAERMLLSLSSFLRHTIDTDPAQLTPLGQEARIQRLYLEIEKARFGDRLEVSCDIDPALEDCLTPSLLIQPLVENAIKYAVAPNPNGAHVSIGAYERNGQLVLFVADDGPGLGDGAGRRAGGVGLRNIRERLLANFGANACMTLLPSAAQRGLRVEIAMPLLRAPAAV